MIIDIHTHIYSEEAYKTYFEKARGRVSRVLVLQDEPAHRVLNSRDLFDFVANKDNLYIIENIDVNAEIDQQLKERQKLFEEKKILGIKLYPGYQYFYPSDEKIYPIVELCQRYNKPLIFHSGDVYDPDNKALLEYSHPIYIDKLAVKFPKCKIVISHFGFPYHLEAANVVSKNSNVYTDISGTINKVNNKKEAKNLFNQYLKDLFRVFSYFPDVKKKIMFGTDYCGEDTPLHELESYIKLVKRIFSKNEQKSVFYELAEKIYFND